jgi:hypothetical protein
MRVVAFDTETYPIGPGALAPKAVCGAFAERDETREMNRWLLGNAPEDKLEEALEALLRDPDVTIVTHSGGYDWSVSMASYPRLIPAIFAAALAGRFTDTKWREKLLNLSTSGRLDKLLLPDGSKADIKYGLADLELKYTGNDRRAEKVQGAAGEGDDHWRLAYAALDGWRASEYPEDAAAYALADAEATLLVYEAQEQRKIDFPHASTATEEFRTATHVALYLMSAHGVETNPEEVARVRAETNELIAGFEAPLIAAGLVQAPQPARPHANQAKKVAALAAQGVIDPIALAAAGIKFVEAKKSKRNLSAIQSYVGALYLRLGEVPAMTAGGENKAPQIQLDAEVQDYLAMKDPLMESFQGRQSLQKILEQLDILESGPVIYPQYDVLKETGRTSSYGNSRDREPLYPSANIQQVPGERDGIDPRRCYRPRAGRVFFDVDITNLELATVAQRTHDLHLAGIIPCESVHLLKYNAKVDLHGYLATSLQLQLATDGPGREFQEACRAEGVLSDPDACYEAFMLCKKHSEEPIRKWFKVARNFAKPVGLGFPGGLGPDTLVEFAWGTYGVRMTPQQASDARDVWRLTYPEMPYFFKWIEGQTDNVNGQTERGEQLYWYETPLGMIRRGATFCAAANGNCMQSPGAEVAETWTIMVQRECYDPTQESVLLGCRPVAFVHDQIIGETTPDEALWHDQAMRVRELLVEHSRLILPDVNIRSDEAHLTRVWSKASGPAFGPDGRLIPWEPK